MSEPWRLIETWDGGAGFNMALDEALLLSQAAPPSLRFYTWKPDTLSLGYFQRWVDVPDVERAGRVVRRMTGGGAIHHAAELTFSIAAPLTHALYRGPVAESYARIHGWIATCLLRFGVHASLRGAAKVDSDREDTGMCFHHSTPMDLVWDSAKGVGSAQRRKGGRVLHHGSIKIGTTELEGPIATLLEHAEDLQPKGLAQALESDFELGFDARLRKEQPSAAELAHARERADFFESDGFVHRR